MAGLTRTMKRHTPLLPCTQQQCRIRVKRNRGSSRALSVFDWLHGRSFYRFEWPSALLRLLAIWLAHAVDLVLGWCGRLQHAACALWTHSKQQQCSSLGAAPDDIPTNLLALPDQCLLAVMQCCAHDTPSTISAATAHSRLHQAAVEALGSMTVISAKCRDQARVDSMLLYLSKHGQHVRSLALHGQQRWDVQRLELPLSLTKLEGLLLEGMRLHLQPGSGGTQGVLRAGLHLTRLELSDCMLLDGVEALAAALMQLPDLEHLRAGSLSTKGMQVFFPFDVLPHLQQLTCLILVHSQGRASNRIARKGDITSQSLQALTRLADLEFASPGSSYRERVTADMLSSADQLTRLVLSNADFAPSGLAGRTQLQHLTLRDCSFPTKYRPVADAPQLLFELQHFTQLTHLDLGGSCGSIDDLVGPSPQPAAYASLIASSELQHLDFSSNTLPAAAWQYMWPPGMTLPQLRHLDIRAIKELGDSLALPDTSVLVSCCPGLQTLRSTMPCSTAQLAPLQQLTGLHTLAVGAGGSVDSEGLQALCKLTGLQELHLPTTYPSAEARACILQLTQLTRLTHLHCTGYRTLCCNPQDPASKPVWLQLLREVFEPTLLLLAREQQRLRLSRAAAVDT